MNISVLNRLITLILTSLFIIIGIVLLKEMSNAHVKNNSKELIHYTIYD